MRRTGAIGLVSFALIAVAGLLEPLWDVPGTTASGDAVRSYLAANRDGFIGALTVYAFGMALFVVFAAALWGHLRPFDPEIALVFVIGASALAVLVFAGFVPMLVLAYRAPDVSSPRELYDLCFGLLALSGAPTAIAMGAYVSVVWRTRALPLVTAWLAVLAALAHIVIVFSFVPRSGFFSLEGGVIVAIPSTLFLWLLATSLALTMSSEAQQST
jgi:hypothetical protein